MLPSTRRLVIVDGMSILAETRTGKEVDGIARQLIFAGVYEPVTTNLLRSYLKPGMRVADVGANIGYYTLIAAHYVGASGIVWAFEPEQHNFAALIDNVQRNTLQNVRPSMVAVSDTIGVDTLYVSGEESGEHSLVVARHCKDKVVVPTTTLDSVIGDATLHVLKTDTEGNDVKVLRGAKHTLQRSNCLLIVEFWPEGILKGGSTPQELWDYLVACGFSHFYVADEVEKTLSVGTLESTLKHCNDRKFSVNLVCSKEVII